MAVKLADIILALSIERACVIFALLIEMLGSIIIAQLLKKLCIDCKAASYHPYSINKSASRCHLNTILKVTSKDGLVRLSQICNSWGPKEVILSRQAYAYRSISSNIKG